jgi:hypothetical protein
MLLRRLGIAATSLGCGSGGRRRRVVCDACLLCQTMASVCIAALLGGNAAMIRVCHAQEFAETRPVVSVLLVALLPTTVGMPASNAPASIEHFAQSSGPVLSLPLRSWLPQIACVQKVPSCFSTACFPRPCN